GVAGELNNVQASTATVAILPTTFARLNVTAVNVPSTATAGQPMAVSYTVANAGSLPASGSWTDLVYLASSPHFDTNSALLFGTVPVTNGLSAGASYSNSLTNTVPPCVAGPVYVFVLTDWQNVVNGISCETNDILGSTQAVAVTAVAHPDLQAFSLQAPV